MGTVTQVHSQAKRQKTQLKTMSKQKVLLTAFLLVALTVCQIYAQDDGEGAVNVGDAVDGAIDAAGDLLDAAQDLVNGTISGSGKMVAGLASIFMALCLL